MQEQNDLDWTEVLPKLVEIIEKFNGFTQKEKTDEKG